MTANETKKIPASQYGDRDYGTAARATKACLGDWLTSGGVNDVPEAPAAQLARELFASPEGRQWISIERDEDGLPVDGELRCDEEQAARVIAEIQDGEKHAEDYIERRREMTYRGVPAPDAALDNAGIECQFCSADAEDPAEKHTEDCIERRREMNYRAMLARDALFAPDETDETECVYCGRDVETAREDAPAPSLADDAEWTRLGKQHAPDCEWIVTRAHRL